MLINVSTKYRHCLGELARPKERNDRGEVVESVDYDMLWFDHSLSLLPLPFGSGSLLVTASTRQSKRPMPTSSEVRSPKSNP